MKSKHILSIFAVAMLAYQGWRVYDYMSASLQGVSDTVRLVVAIAFLAFSEIGLLVWLHIGQPHATTDLQETTANLMIWFCFAGSMILGLADLAKHNTLYVIDLSAVDPLLFLAPWALVIGNVGGYLVYTMNDSENRLEREERRLLHEEHQLEMAARRAAIRELRSNKESLASKLSPYYFKDVTDRISGRTVNRFARQAGKIRKDEAEQMQQLPGGLFSGLLSGNGAQEYHQETDSPKAAKKSGKPSA